MTVTQRECNRLMGRPVTLSGRAFDTGLLQPLTMAQKKLPSKDPWKKLAGQAVAIFVDQGNVEQDDFATGHYDTGDLGQGRPAERRPLDIDAINTARG